MGGTLIWSVVLAASSQSYTMNKHLVKHKLHLKSKQVCPKFNVSSSCQTKGYLKG